MNRQVRTKEGEDHSMKLTMRLGPRSYDIILSRGALGRLGQLANLMNRRVLVVTAPPCTRLSRPLSASSAISRRMVIAETPSSLDSAVMRTAPLVRNRLRIRCCRCDEIM